MKIDWEHIPTIDANRVSLRHFTARDVAAIYDIYADPEVMRYWGASPMVAQREAKDFLSEAREDLRLGKCLQWAIARRSDGQLIGTVAFFKLDTLAGKVEIGFALGRNYWGVGYMQEALQAALGFGFNEIGVRRIEADVDPRNISSIRLLEGLGFQREGFLRERWLVSGATQDSLFYGLLKKDWSDVGVFYRVVPSQHEEYATFSRTRIANSRVGRWGAVMLGWLH